MRRLGLLMLFLGLTILGTSLPAGSAGEDGYNLEKIQIQPLEGDKSCGPYFILTTYGGRSAERLVFHFIDKNEKVVSDTMKLSAVSVVIGEKDKVPTIQFGKNDDGERTMILRISPEDKQEATCLPEAKKEGNVKGGH